MLQLAERTLAVAQLEVGKRLCGPHFDVMDRLVGFVRSLREATGHPQRIDWLACQSQPEGVGPFEAARRCGSGSKPGRLVGLRPGSRPSAPKGPLHGLRGSSRPADGSRHQASPRSASAWRASSPDFSPVAAHHGRGGREQAQTWSKMAV